MLGSSATKIGGVSFQDEIGMEGFNREGRRGYLAGGAVIMTFTKEQLAKIIESADEVISACDGTNEDVHPESDDMLRLWDYLNDVAAPPQVVKRLAEIALAALESRADADQHIRREVNVGGNTWVQCSNAAFEKAKSEGKHVRELYERPQPAPVVPDELLSAMEEVLRISDRDHEAWNKAKAGIVACHASRAEPVSQPYTLPECFDRLFKHAQGLTFGDDWNRGTAAKYHRDSLIKAVDDCRAMLAAAPQQEANNG